ncbi:MAG TPA: FAD-dependent oxidoreductase, partial [Acidimicrobiia bacterium]|nr:FAD-dependent oxidoreductase [Acidimicrobiia bacterium]
MVVGEVAVGADLLVVGGGPGGYAAALRGAAAGRSVTLVERDRIGGVCLNVGCIPSKALIHVADTAGLPGEAAAIGVDLTASVDLDRAQGWIGEVVARLTGGVEQLLRDAGVTVATGTARFATARRVAVTRGDDATFYEFKSMILATGSRPTELAALPFDGRTVLDSTAALALRRVPRRLTVVGGGYIGVELGGAWAKLGAEVTVVELADQLLPGMPAGLARTLERALRARGVSIHLATKVLGTDGDDLVVEGPAGEARLPIRRSSVAPPATQERRLGGADEGDEEDGHTDGAVVVAVGRRPNTDSLGLAAAGVTLDADGRIRVAPDRRAGADVYAIGDITPGPALAHKATAEADVAVTAAGGRRAAFDPAVIPAVVYSDPQIATVGVTAEGAREAGADPMG